MKNLFLFAILLLTASCGYPDTRGYPSENSFLGFRLQVLPNADTATMYDFHRAPPDYALRYVATIAEAAQMTGLRCKPGSNVTVRGIYYELLTRTYNNADSLIREQFAVMNNLGCN